MLNLTAAFSSFERWTVGLGIEHQLQALQAAVGLQPTKVSGCAGGVRHECDHHNVAATQCGVVLPSSPLT